MLILCTGNSCRSQIAEAYLRQYIGHQVDVYSAGVETHGVNPRAVSVLKEDQIDISSHTSNHVDEFAHIPFDYVLTVCDHANESCPILLGNFQKYHQNFPDPAKATGTDHEIMQEFRHVRDLIKKYCRQLADELLHPQ